MQVLRNHFEGKTTIIINKNIINGCQSFTIDNYKEVCKEFGVSEDVIKSGLEAYYEDLELEECNINECINGGGFQVRYAIAKFGNDSHRDTLVNDEDWDVRWIVAKYGKDSHRDILKNDEEEEVREAAKRYYKGELK